MNCFQEWRCPAILDVNTTRELGRGGHDQCTSEFSLKNACSAGYFKSSQNVLKSIVSGRPLWLSWMNNAWEVYFQRKLDFSQDIQRLDITRLKLSTQSTLSLVTKIIGLLKHGWIHPQKQSCQLSWIIWETPDFGPYLPVSSLEYEILPDNRRILPFLVESTFRQ